MDKKHYRNNYGGDKIRIPPQFDKEKIRKRLWETILELQKLTPKVKSSEPIIRICENSSIEDMSDFIAICIKYLALDLEATRRENTYLRKMIEENDNDDRDKGVK
jgi:hypothetical protein